MLIRKAREKDARVLAELVYTAAPRSLSALFDVAPTLNCQGYFAQTFQRESGQYGFGNHWVVEAESQVVAAVTAWHSELSENFHHASLTRAC